MFLEGPGDSGLKRFGDALQESAASLHTIELLLRHAMLVVVCRGQQREGDCWRSKVNPVLHVTYNSTIIK